MIEMVFHFQFNFHFLNNQDDSKFFLEFFSRAHSQLEAEDPSLYKVILIVASVEVDSSFRILRS